jgi:hypothetical protein
MPQFRLFRGKSGCFFVEDITTKKQASLRTRDANEASVICSVLPSFTSIPIMTTRWRGRRCSMWR